MKIQKTKLEDKMQVRFQETTEFGDFSDALYYTLEEWKTVTEEEVRNTVQGRIDNWVSHMRRSAPISVEPAIEPTPPRVLLLFGAGASYGALGVSPKPPLRADLFSKLCERFPGTWGKLSAEIADIFSNRGPEKGMEALDDAEHGLSANLVQLMIEMAIYFSEFKIPDTNSNLYCRLIRRFAAEIQRGDILLSTLNYECLLELALAHSGIQQWSYLLPTAVRVLKMHGSCNFIPQNVELGGANLTVNWTYKGQIRTPNAFPKFVLPNMVKEELARTGMPPAMSIYTETKPTPICPEFVAKIRAAFLKGCASARTIIAVGVNPNPADDHIWGTLSNSAAELFLVAKKQSCDQWIADYGNGKALYLGETFEEKYSALISVMKNALGTSAIPTS
jgi:hypothetical protein